MHGGGFYHQQKYPVAPARLPEQLHWSMWESYSTWLTGFALFTVLYLFNAGTFLIDRNVLRLVADGGDRHRARVLRRLLARSTTRPAASSATRPARRPHRRRAGRSSSSSSPSWLSCHLFAGRAAFLLVGAVMATTMTANVAHWIIPGQRKVVAALREGRPVDPVHGQRGKQRSVHNTYFTLPVVFTMISNHYGFVFGAKHNWLVLVVLMLAGALVRVSFVLRHKALVERRPVPWRWAIAGTLLVAATVAVLLPAPPRGDGADAAADLRRGARRSSPQRCSVCHNAALPNKNVRLDSAAEDPRPCAGGLPAGGRARSSCR